MSNEKVIALSPQEPDDTEGLVKDNPPGQCCRTCDFHFLVGIHREGLKKIIICRRYPPTVGFFPGPLNRPITGADFPPIDEKHWCGEWKPKTTRVVTH